MKIFISFLLLFVLNFAYGSESSELLNKELEGMKTMTASFNQVVKANKKTLSRSSGKMSLYRPGRFRWKTIDPMAQLIVADGKQIWVYDVDLEQVTVKKQSKNLGGTAALFLSGYDSTLGDNYNIKIIQKGKNKQFDMKAKSAKMSDFQRIKMQFIDGVLKKLDLYDQLGQITEVTLNKIKINSNIDKSLFKFVPPKGVDVIKQ